MKSLGHHQSSPLLCGPRMHCNARKLSKRYWEKPGELGERVDHYNSSLGQITHVTQCILQWRFQRCLLGMPITRMSQLTLVLVRYLRKATMTGSSFTERELMEWILYFSFKYLFLIVNYCISKIQRGKTSFSGLPLPINSPPERQSMLSAFCEFLRDTGAREDLYGNGSFWC